MRKLILAAFAALSFATAPAENIFEGLAYNIRVGYSIGGTAPLGMPASIRKLNDYTLTNNLQLGIDARHMFDSRWGVMAGLHFENKGMDEDARVKNYKMKIVRGGQELEGRFTGDVHTKVSEWMFTVPVLATYSVGNFLLKAGPYFSYVHSRSFSGDAHNGYLREETLPERKYRLGMIRIPADITISRTICEGCSGELTWEPIGISTRRREFTPTSVGVCRGYTTVISRP